MPRAYLRFSSSSKTNFHNYLARNSSYEFAQSIQKCVRHWFTMEIQFSVDYAGQAPARKNIFFYTFNNFIQLQYEYSRRFSYGYLFNRIQFFSMDFRGELWSLRRSYWKILNTPSDTILKFCFLLHKYNTIKIKKTFFFFLRTPSRCIQWNK